MIIILFLRAFICFSFLLFSLSRCYIVWLLLTWASRWPVLFCVSVFCFCFWIYFVWQTWSFRSCLSLTHTHTHTNSFTKVVVKLGFYLMSAILLKPTFICKRTCYSIENTREANMFAKPVIVRGRTRHVSETVLSKTRLTNSWDTAFSECSPLKTVCQCRQSTGHADHRQQRSAHYVAFMDEQM